MGLVDPLSFASVNFRDLPGLMYLQSLGETLLGLGLVMCFGQAALQLIRQGCCDLITPLIRFGMAYFALEMLPTLGGLLYDGSMELSGLMGKSSHLELFSQAFAHIADATSSSSAVLTTVLGGQVFVLSVVMAFSKMMVVDIIFPVALGIVLMFGTLSIPIGLFPGVNSLSGWVRNLIEVSLYPICFQLVVGQLTSQFSGLLKQVAAADFVNFFGALLSIWEQRGNLSEIIPQSPYFLLIKFFAFCLVYIVLTTFSPALAMMVMRGRSVGAIGGMLAAKGASLVAGGARMVAGSAMARGALGRLAAGSALQATVQGAVTQPVASVVSMAASNAPQGGADMNKRNFRSADRQSRG